MLAIASARSAPIARPVGAPGVSVADASVDRLGVGVAGTAAWIPEVWAGAGGTAGVLAMGCAGVAGGAAAAG